MKLGTAVKVAHSCGLSTYGEAYDNVRTHAGTSFSYEDSSDEIRELIIDIQNEALRLGVGLEEFLDTEFPVDESDYNKYIVTIGYSMGELSSTYVIINAPTETTARQTMIHEYGTKWSFIYGYDEYMNTTGPGTPIPRERYSGIELTYNDEVKDMFDDRGN